MKLRVATACAGLLALLVGAAPVRAASPQFLADCQALTKSNHRLTGSPEYAAAAGYVTQRLRAIGVDRVIEQPFPSANLALKRCRITVAGRGSLPLFPARPNGIVPPVTPREGLTGELLIAGKGDLTDYGTRAPQGKIVVLDYNSGDGWLRAFRLGAKAVVFVHGAQCQSWQAHYTEASANLPRFYYPGNPKDLREGALATLESEVTWEPGMARNIVAYVKGTNPTFSLEKREVILLAANLDSYGEVPHLAKGARGAANCAALLEIAEGLVKHRPRRDTLLVFFDGQAHGHLGASVFYRALEADSATAKLAAREQSQKDETKFLDTVHASLKGPDALSDSSAFYDEVMRRLKTKAAEHVYVLNGNLEDIRNAVAELHKDARSASLVASLNTQAKSLQADKDVWNELRRALAHNDLQRVRKEPMAGRWAMIVGEARADVEHRQAELRDRTALLKADKDLSTLLADSRIVLHASLLLGDTSPRWGLLIGGDSALHSTEDSPGLYGKIQNTFLTAAKKLAEQGRPVQGFESATADGTLSSKLCWSGKLVHSGEIAGKTGIYNLALGTIQEKREREGTPDDTVANLNADWVEGQVTGVARLLAEVSNSDGLSLRSAIVPSKNYVGVTLDTNGKIQGPTVMGTTRGSSMPNKPMPDTLVQLFPASPINFVYEPAKTPAFDNYQLFMTDGNATYSYGPVQPDPNNTIRGFAARFNERGDVVAVSDGNSASSVKERMNLFFCAMPTLKHGIPAFISRTGAAVLPAQIEGAETQVMQALSNGPLDKGLSNFATRDGVVYWFCEQRVEGIKLFGLQATVALMNGDEHAGFGRGKRDPLGVGYSLLEPWQFFDTSLRSAADLWRLNETRLDVLRSRAVINSSLEELHARAEDLLNAANAAKTVAAREALATSSFFAQRPVYNTIRSSLDDLVRAVLILLALAIPFAFAMERLLIGSTNIYRQILWFCIFFASTFFVLYLVHPSFGVSSQPIIIFLAFALMLLSSLVIFVIMQKFEQELKILQGLTSTVHNADVSRFNTMMAAVGMGISTMRRRPVRTALTALTITLLTFVILNFASFDASTGVVTLFKGSSPPYSGVLVHDVNWGKISPALMDVLTGRWGDTTTVTCRYWGESQLVTRGDGSSPMTIKGVLGLSEREIRAREDLRRVFGDAASRLQDGVFLTRALAGQVGVNVGDNVIVGGCRLKVGGLLDSSAMSGITDMDESSILPVDFAATAGSTSSGSDASQQKAAQSGQALLAAVKGKQDWVVLPTDSVVIVSNATAQRMGASLRVATLYVKDAAAATNLAEDMARMLPLPITATRADGVFTHVLAPTVAAKGVKDLIFPILLGGLVIFGTMLGSVADREKEIYTFSALGLAPAHVATLFFAEALVYSFIGGMGGYLLAQAMLKLLILLSTYGLVGVPEMNYSSFNAIITILIVMGTVLISAIYPAFKASRSANPGILRQWRTPPPAGDRFDIVFPFTVSQYDITGVMSFLKEHFDNFADTSLGVFMARGTLIERGDDGLILRSFLALAPFDLGVTQTFALTSTPSEIPGIDEVKIMIGRESGQRKDWARLNRLLLDDLRRQFLIWRSLPQDTMELYRTRTLVTLGEAREREAVGVAE